MHEGEVTFLLRVLNYHFPYGHVKDEHPLSVLEGQLYHRLLTLGLVAEFHPDYERWYVHQNDETSLWQ